MLHFSAEERARLCYNYKGSATHALNFTVHSYTGTLSLGCLISQVFGIYQTSCSEQKALDK